MSAKHAISIIYPVHNEIDNVYGVVKESISFIEKHSDFECFEIILVDDGSFDGTQSILNQIKKEHPGNVVVITQEKCFGYGRAMTDGINIAKYPYILLMDADGQFRLDSLDEAIRFIPDYDIVSGFREKRKDPLHRVFLGQLYTTMVFLIFGIKLKDVNCGFKLFKREALLVDRLDCHSGVFYTSILVEAISKGFKLKEFSIKHYPRKSGKSSGGSLKVVWNSIVDLIRLKKHIRKKRDV